MISMPRAPFTTYIRMPPIIKYAINAARALEREGGRERKREGGKEKKKM